MRELRISDRTRDVLADLHGRTITGVLVPADEARSPSFSSVLVQFSTGADVLFHVEALELHSSASAGVEFFVIAAEEIDEPAVTWVPRPMQYLVTPITAVSLLRVQDEVSLHDGTAVVAARVDAGVVVRLGRGHLAFTTAGEMPMTLRVEVGLNGYLAFEGDEEEIRKG